MKMKMGRELVAGDRVLIVEAGGLIVARYIKSVERLENWIEVSLDINKLKSIKLAGPLDNVLVMED